MACDCHWIRISAEVTIFSGSAHVCGQPDRDDDGNVIFPITRWWEIDERHVDLFPSEDPDRRLDTSTFETPLVRPSSEGCPPPVLTSVDGEGSGDNSYNQTGSSATQEDVRAKAMELALENQVTITTVITQDETSGDHGGQSEWHVLRNGPVQQPIITAEDAESEGAAIYQSCSVKFSRIGSKVPIRIQYSIQYSDGGIPIGDPVPGEVFFGPSTLESENVPVTVPTESDATRADMTVTSIIIPDIDS